MDPKFTYILDTFRASYDIPFDIKIGYGSDQELVNIRKSRTGYFEIYDRFAGNSPVWKEWADQKIPFLFDQSDDLPLLEFRNGRAFIHYDILASAFFFLSGWQEYVYMLRNNACRYPFSDSLQKELGIVKVPVVNYYFDILKSAIERVYGLELRVKAWDGASFAVCLSHDIDSCMTGWLFGGWSELRRGRFLSAARLISRRLAGRDVWFNFDDILRLEAKYDAHSSFYFMAEKRKIYLDLKSLKSGPDSDLPAKPYAGYSPLSLISGYARHENADYRLNAKRFEPVFTKIGQNGSEIGIHGSITTHLDGEMLRLEKERLGVPAIGNRFHFLYFDRTRSFYELEKAGIKYDTTLGFSEEIGFRNGIAFPFVPYDIKLDKSHRLLEIPLHIMDATFRSYMGTPVEDVLSEIMPMMNQVEKFQGCLALLWHNTFFSPFKYSGWRTIYEQVLREAKARGAFLGSGLQICELWKRNPIQK